MSFVAVSKVACPPSLYDEVCAVGLAMVPVAKRQPGFISIAFHRSYNNDETMIYWEWESKADHEACMLSEDWAGIMGQSQSLFEKEGVDLTIQTYERLA